MYKHLIIQEVVKKPGKAWHSQFYFTQGNLIWQVLIKPRKVCESKGDIVVPDIN